MNRFIECPLFRGKYMVGQAATSNLCKCFIMNSLQNKRLLSGLIILNLVKYGQNKPTRSDFRVFMHSLK